MAAPYGVPATCNKATSADHVTGRAGNAAHSVVVGLPRCAHDAGGGRRRLLAGVLGSLIASATAARGARMAAAQGAGANAQATPGQQTDGSPAQAASTPTQPATPDRQTGPIRLLVLGDSLAAGYGLARQDGFQPRLQAALRTRGFDVVMIDAAVSGDTTAGGRARLDWAVGDGADAAIVELGANDGLRGLDPREMRANLAAILDRLAERRIPVLLSGMYAPPNLGPDYQRAFRAVFDDLGTRPGVVYDPFFLEGVATVNALNQGDGIHPNPEGVHRIVARILPAVERLLAAIHPA